MKVLPRQGSCKELEDSCLKNQASSDCFVVLPRNDDDATNLVMAKRRSPRHPSSR